MSLLDWTMFLPCANNDWTEFWVVFIGLRGSVEITSSYFYRYYGTCIYISPGVARRVGTNKTVWKMTMFYCRCKVGCYTHYPTISTDMLGVVAGGITAHNNPEFITRRRWLSRVCFYSRLCFLCTFLGEIRVLLVVFNFIWICWCIFFFGDGEL